MISDKAKAAILDKCCQKVDCLARGEVIDLEGVPELSQTSPEFETARVALCERLVKYSDDVACIAVHRNLANDLREAEALITLLADAGHAQCQQQPVAWRYKCQDGSEVLHLKRLTDEQKRSGYYTGEGHETTVGPFHWAEETPLYAGVSVSSTDRADTPESVAAEVAYFDAHADRFADAHKDIAASVAVTSPDRRGEP
jgi:hypothetical protein